MIVVADALSETVCGIGDGVLRLVADERCMAVLRVNKDVCWFYSDKREGVIVSCAQMISLVARARVLLLNIIQEKLSPYYFEVYREYNPKNKTRIVEDKGQQFFVA